MPGFGAHTRLRTGDQSASLRTGRSGGHRKKFRGQHHDRHACRASLRTTGDGREFQFAAFECSHGGQHGGQLLQPSRRLVKFKFQGRAVRGPGKLSPTARKLPTSAPEFERLQPVGLARRGLVRAQAPYPGTAPSSGSADRDRTAASAPARDGPCRRGP